MFFFSRRAWHIIRAQGDWFMRTWKYDVGVEEDSQEATAAYGRINDKGQT